ncbi:hypothetical protein [Limnochorda pilosa]|uniref:SHOCT domain-containing protein n=1 Tax=Limnochorda pilosa TaxID=1555112 RepID=A0A0K2SG40_LIMPI|nr:hypothetical protein [Limnochorda pilosa]BAS26073.1 hypothetical protein LIP_0216 [Limnochorda pilosa]
MMLVLAGLLLAIGLSLVVLPLTRGPMGGSWVPARADGGAGEARRRVLAGLAELEMDYRTGKLSKADYRLMKEDLLTRAVQSAGTVSPQAQGKDDLRAALEADVSEVVRRRLEDR